MSTNLSTLNTSVQQNEIISIDINGYYVRIVPAKQYISVNIESALQLNWAAIDGLLGASMHWDGNSVRGYYTFNQLKLMCKKKNVQIPDVLYRYINQQPQIKHDDTKEINIMNMTTTNQPLTMSSQEIADLLECREDSVKRTMERLKEKQLISFTPTVANPTAQGGRPKTVYHVNKRDSYVVVAQLSPEFTAKLVDRWQELENKTATPALPNFADPAEAAIAWANEYKEKEKLQLELKATETVLKEKAPLIGFAETVAKAKNGILIRDLAYLAQNEPELKGKIGEKRLFELFKVMGYLHKDGSNRPMQQYVEQGLFLVSEMSINTHHGIETKFTTRITGKGQVYFINKLKEYFSGGNNNARI